MVIDPRIEGMVRIEGDPANEYQLTEVKWFDPDEANGMHHILIDVLDEDGNRQPGVYATVSWDGGSASVPIEEKPGEPYGGNFPMYATLGAYSVRVSGVSSDKVHGLGLGTPEAPGTTIHTSFGLVFQKAGSSTPPPEPPIPPDNVALDLLTEAEALIAEAKELLS